VSVALTPVALTPVALTPVALTPVVRPTSPVFAARPPAGKYPPVPPAHDDPFAG
jgi:hypothetical protein